VRFPLATCRAQRLGRLLFLFSGVGRAGRWGWVKRACTFYRLFSTVPGKPAGGITDARGRGSRRSTEVGAAGLGNSRAATVLPALPARAAHHLLQLCHVSVAPSLLVLLGPLRVAVVA
jgi:hypothetical protein